MAFYIHIQQTPNPDALKFISQYTVKNDGKSNYRSAEEGAHVPLAEKLFAIDGIRQLYFFDNYITVTRSEGVDWSDLSKKIHDLLQVELPGHNPEYDDQDSTLAAEPVEKSPEVMEIEAILERTVKPYLAADGGGIEVVERKGNYIYVKYQGACGSCPSSIGGTLQAIQSILRDEVDPEIEVIEVGGASAMFAEL
jgi:Fe-S cluster biogenesis protein NfuA